MGKSDKKVGHMKRDYATHMKLHKNETTFEPEIVFRGNKIKAKQTLYEKYFGEAYKECLYLGFDFEALLKKDHYKPDPKKGVEQEVKTTYIQKHIPIGAVVKVWSDGGLFNDFVYAGENVVVMMCEYLESNHNKFVQYKTDKFGKKTTIDGRN